MLPPSYVSGLCAIPDTSASPIWVMLPRLKRSEIGCPAAAPEPLRASRAACADRKARAMGAPLAQLYCEDDKVAEPMLVLH